MKHLFTLILSLLPLCSLSAAQPTLIARGDDFDLQAWRFQATLEVRAPSQLVCQEVGGTLEQHRMRAPISSHVELTLRGLKAATRYSCVLELLDGSSRRTPPVSFVTAPLPSDLVAPKITVPSSNVADTGYTAYNYATKRGLVGSDSYLVILDAEGNVRWYYHGQNRSGIGTSDIDLTWLGNDRLLYGGDVKANVPPTIVGLDKQTYFVGKAQAVSPTDIPTSYTHDVGPSQDGKTIFYINSANIAGVGSTGSSSPMVTGFVIKELDPVANKVVWYWDSVVNGYDPGYLADPGAPYLDENELPNDPYHANAVMDQLENGRLYLYVSLRNQNEIIKIDYLTKAVVWHLGVDGDFQLLEADGTPITSNARWFFGQHDPQAYGHTITMYDNGWDRDYYGGVNYTRALRLELDEQRMTARIAFEYTEPNWLEGIFGGHDILANGNSLIAMGHTGYQGGTTNHPSALVEVNTSGKVVWRADFGSLTDTIYRAQRISGCAIFSDTRYCPAGRN